MDAKIPGVLIRRERIAKNWGQESLCRGICAVSYLSKIEQGKAEASPEILRLLLEKLGTPWYDDAASLTCASGIVERAYETLWSGDKRGHERALGELAENRERCVHGPYVLDALLLAAFAENRREPLADDCRELLDTRQRTLALAVHGEYDELTRVNPIAFSYLLAGEAAYERGAYGQAAELLQRGYELAADAGEARMMLQCRMLLGNCASNVLDYERMAAHYRIAERLAEALREASELETIRYNTAATALERGRSEEAYAYFSKLASPKAMELHKLAICCEKLGKREEALAALDKVETAPEGYPERSLTLACCALVRYRLLHPDYLSREAYGAMLVSCFDRIRRELPHGYASFHLPWMLEWYRAARQYKLACELLLQFPEYPALMEHNAAL